MGGCGGVESVVEGGVGVDTPMHTIYEPISYRLKSVTSNSFPRVDDEIMCRYEISFHFMSFMLLACNHCIRNLFVNWS